MTDLQNALEAMGRVDFTNVDPHHQNTMGQFLERALAEIVQREAAVQEREGVVSKRESDVQIREERAEAQLKAIESAQRLVKGLGMVQVETKPAPKDWGVELNGSWWRRKRA
jgi:hypothetical protein